MQEAKLTHSDKQKVFFFFCYMMTGLLTPFQLLLTSHSNWLTIHTTIASRASQGMPSYLVTAWNHMTTGPSTSYKLSSKMPRWERYIYSMTSQLHWITVQSKVHIFWSCPRLLTTSRSNRPRKIFYSRLFSIIRILSYALPHFQLRFEFLSSLRRNA